MQSVTKFPLPRVGWKAVAICLGIAGIPTEAAFEQVSVTEGETAELLRVGGAIADSARTEPSNLIEKSASSAVSNFFSGSGINLPNLVDYFSIALNSLSLDTTGPKQALTFTFNPGPARSLGEYQGLPGWKRRSNISVTLPGFEIAEILSGDSFFGNSALRQVGVETKFLVLGTRDHRDQKYNDRYGEDVEQFVRSLPATLDEEQRERFSDINSEIGKKQMLQDRLADSLDLLDRLGRANSEGFERVFSLTKVVGDEIAELERERYGMMKHGVADYIDEVNAEIDKSGLVSLSYGGDFSIDGRPVHRANLAWSKGVGQGVYGTANLAYAFEPDSVLIGENVSKLQGGLNTSWQPLSEVWKETQGGLKIAVEGILDWVLQDEAFGRRLTTDEKLGWEVRMILTMPFAESWSLALSYVDGEPDFVKKRIILGVSCQMLKTEFSKEKA